MFSRSEGVEGRCWEGQGKVVELVLARNELASIRSLPFLLFVLSSLFKDFILTDIFVFVFLSRPLQNLNQLLSLVALFPTINLSSTPDDDAPSSPSQTTTTSSSSSEPDLSALLERIRARYKLTCSSLGIRPRLTAAKMTDADEEEGGGEALKGKVVVNGVGVSSKALLF